MVAVSNVGGTQARYSVSNPGSGGHATTGGLVTVSAGDTICVVFITMMWQGDGSHTNLSIDSVTVGGTACTLVPSSTKYGVGGTNADGLTSIYSLTSPASSPGTGSQAVVVTGSSPAPQLNNLNISGLGVTYSGTLNASPIGTAFTGAANAVSSETAAVTSMATGDLAVGIGVNGSSAPGVTTGTSDFSKANTTNGGVDNYCVAHNSGTGTVNIVWSTNSGDESSYSAFRIIAGTATTKAPPFSTPRLRNNMIRRPR